MCLRNVETSSLILNNQEKKDIDYLRQTLRGHENLYENEEMLDFAEKADNLIEEQEEVIAAHTL